MIEIQSLSSQTSVRLGGVLTQLQSQIDLLNVMHLPIADIERVIGNLDARYAAPQISGSDSTLIKFTKLFMAHIMSGQL